MRDWDATQMHRGRDQSFRCVSANGCDVKYTTGLGGGVAHSVKNLPCKKEDLSLIPWTHIKMEDMVVHACNPDSGEMETRGSQEAHWPVSLAN